MCIVCCFSPLAGNLMLESLENRNPLDWAVCEVSVPLRGI
ncbi:hypothetical protein M595_2329 [Lyngbya aestuarii BL J]|uniref:Uncharacterized protein n=1 Tax=Lyngbya aestuarii BL J TaxID=1348334 RepID=U7QKR1_9CYAN|nr:hypothetical protein M595_2329 [Lyngbya aestuarii BL J]